MQPNVALKDLAREDVGRLLAACYYQPGAELREEQVFEKLGRAAALVDPALGERARRLGEAFDGATPEELLLDYAGLFLGPFEIRAKPYGSVWLEGEKIAMGETTVALQALYEEGGFTLAEDFRELPDHVAAELEFLYLLIFKENEGRRAGDLAALAASADLRRRFLGGHLGRWVGPFAAAVGAAAETPFYRELAALTEAFVRAEAASAGA